MTSLYRMSLVVEKDFLFWFDLDFFKLNTRCLEYFQGRQKTKSHSTGIILSPGVMNVL